MMSKTNLFYFQQTFATDKGFSKSSAAWLISFMSMPSVAARLVFGKLADHPKVNKLLMFQICLGIMALSTILCPFVSSEYAGFAVYMVVFGICEGCIVGTAPTLVAHIVGRHRISPALGLLFCSFAVPLMLGASFAGMC
jgi:MCP family monocarboxylic acid transporter-like MFS transporter 10